VGGEISGRRNRREEEPEEAVFGCIRGRRSLRRP